MKIIRSCAVLVALLIFTFTAVQAHALDKTEPNDFTRAVEFGSKGDFKKAVKYLNKSREGHPLFTPADHLLKITQDLSNKKIKEETAIHIFKGILLSTTNSLDESIKEFDLAVKTDPDYSDTFALRAMIRSLQNDLDGATSDLYKAVKLAPDNFMAYYLRGSLYASKNIFTHALNDLDKAIELNPDMAAAYNNRAGLHYNKGEFDLAITDMTYALELAPKTASLYEMRGFLYAVRLNDNARGCLDLKKACELGSCDSLDMAKKRKICD